MVRDLKLFRWVMPMTPQRVAKAFICGLQKDSPEILVGWQSHLAVWCQRLCPWLLEMILQLATPQPQAPKTQQPVKKQIKGLSRVTLDLWPDFSRVSDSFAKLR
jgi:3-oxoacyl-[acyl-carrier protein] reductase